jgi:hypothetical protein
LVVRAIDAGMVERRLLFPEGGGIKVAERWEAIPIQSDQMLAEVRLHLGELEEVLAPADRGALLARVLALLSHFRAEANPPQIEQAMADDWAEDLAEFPMWAVEEACRSWRRTRKWRPQICEILALCRESVGEATARRDRLRALVVASDTARNPMADRVRKLARSTFRNMPG